MRFGNTSQLGPWNRFQEPQQHTLYNQTKNETFRPQLVLPKVFKPRQFLIKGRRSKQKFYQPLKMKPIQFQINKDKSEHSNSQFQVSEGRKSQTLQFDASKIFTHSRNFQKFSKSKQKATFFQDTNRFNEQQNKWSMSPKMNKIDLIAQYLEAQEKQQQKQSSKIAKIKQYQFAKKRSLIQMLRFLRFSPQASLSDRPGNIYKLQKVGRYEGYLNMMGQSRGQSTYLPNFNTRKSNSLGKRK